MEPLDLGPGCILPKPQLVNTNQTCRGFCARLVAACVLVAPSTDLVREALKEIFLKYTETLYLKQMNLGYLSHTSNVISVIL